MVVRQAGIASNTMDDQHVFKCQMEMQTPNTHKETTGIHKFYQKL